MHLEEKGKYRRPPHQLRRDGYLPQKQKGRKERRRQESFREGSHKTLEGEKKEIACLRKFTSKKKNQICRDRKWYRKDKKGKTRLS